MRKDDSDWLMKVNTLMVELGIVAQPRPGCPSPTTSWNEEDFEYLENLQLSEEPALDHNTWKADVANSTKFNP